MADDFNFNVLSKGYIRTYPTPKAKAKLNAKKIHYADPEDIEKREPLTTKNAVRLLLQGTLKSEVCRYCLNVTKALYELDQIMHVTSKGLLFKVTVRDMLASFHPIKVPDDPNFPNKVCCKCLDNTIKSYLFAQQCEQAERALRNCFEDMYEKLSKLDPIETQKKRGRRKLNPNHNVLYTEHEKVISYAEPLINLVHTSSEPLLPTNPVTELECLKCCQLLSSVEELLNHEKIHPKTMWYNCRICGRSFSKRYLIKRHLQSHLHNKPNITQNPPFSCSTCGCRFENYKELLQHIEKHKFKSIMEHLLERKMDTLCTVCLDKGKDMVDLDNNICLHGGCPNLSGDQTIHSILSSTLPDMSILNNYTGTKICEKCLNQAINTYIFTNQFLFNRNRLNTCITLMIDNLNNIKNIKGNIFIEISQNTIMPVYDDLDDIYLCDRNDFIDETKLKIDVLEDEFRINSDNESDTEKKTHVVTSKNLNVNDKQNSLTVCSEFLYFKTKPKRTKVKFTCPMCNKHFVTGYHLKKHIIKHINKKVTCRLCFKEFKSKFHLNEHNKVHLLKRELSDCTQCGRAFINNDKLKEHVKTHSRKFCVLCDKVFKSQKHYDIHIQRHKIKFNEYKNRYGQNCNFCEQEFVCNNELYRHINKEHIQLKPYECEMCDKKFYTEKNLKCHKKVHSLYSKEICVFCNKKLNCRRQLVHHVWKHIGVKPFSCQICAEAFHRKSKLSQHLKLYHGVNFCCTFCKKVFDTQLGLKKHEKTDHSFI